MCVTFNVVAPKPEHRMERVCETHTSPLAHFSSLSAPPHSSRIRFCSPRLGATRELASTNMVSPVRRTLPQTTTHTQTRKPPAWRGFGSSRRRKNTRTKRSEITYENFFISLACQKAHVTKNKGERNSCATRKLITKRANASSANKFKTYLHFLIQASYLALWRAY